MGVHVDALPVGEWGGNVLMGNHLPQSRIGRGIDRPGRRAVGATWFMVSFNARPCDQRIEHRSALETAPGPSPTAAPRNSFQHRCPQPVSHCFMFDKHNPHWPSTRAIHQSQFEGGDHISCSPVGYFVRERTVILKRAKQMLEPVLPGTEMDANPQACSRRF